MATIGKEEFGCLSILFPDLSGDEGWVDNAEVEGVMELLRQLLWLVEVVEDIVWVLSKSSIELHRGKSFQVREGS